MSGYLKEKGYVKLWMDYARSLIIFNNQVAGFIPNICWMNEWINLLKIFKFLFQVLICCILST